MIHFGIILSVLKITFNVLQIILKYHALQTLHLILTSYLSVSTKVLKLKTYVCAKSF